MKFLGIDYIKKLLPSDEQFISVAKKLKDRDNKSLDYSAVEKMKSEREELILKTKGMLQVSSCDVERVFSQLKLVRDRCNDNLLEYKLEVRLFALCNGNLKSLLIKAWEFPLEDVDEDDEWNK